jgi:hypothetical protein
MTGTQPEIVPEQETRGGENPDWENVRPGEPLPVRPRETEPDPRVNDYVGQHRSGDPD